MMDGYDKLYKDMEAGKIISAYAVRDTEPPRQSAKWHLAINLVSELSIM